MNRRIVLTLIFIAGCLQLLAVPPLRRPLVHKQPDGTRLTLFREHADDFIFYTTTDGLTLLRDDSGTFRYASLLGGKLKKCYSFELPYDCGSRTLVCIEKVQPTPDKYPRNNGKIKSKPL